MMEHNVTNTDLTVFGYSQESASVSYDIQHLTKLNESGRKAFVDPASTKDELLRVLAAVISNVPPAQHVNSFFHLLSLKPTLCDHPSLSSAARHQSLGGSIRQAGRIPNTRPTKRRRLQLE